MDIKFKFIGRYNQARLCANNAGPMGMIKLTLFKIMVMEPLIHSRIGTYERNKTNHTNKLQNMDNPNVLLSNHKLAKTDSVVIVI